MSKTEATEESVTELFNKATQAFELYVREAIKLSPSTFPLRNRFKLDLGVMSVGVRIDNANHADRRPGSIDLNKAALPDSYVPVVNRGFAGPDGDGNYGISFDAADRVIRLRISPSDLRWFTDAATALMDGKYGHSTTSHSETSAGIPS